LSPLSHFGADGKAAMVDVSAKPETARVAVAGARVEMQPETLAVILAGTVDKGDVLGVARLAGIMAAKRTADLIPLCHPLPLSSVRVDFERESGTVLSLRAEVRTTGRTGVEMEALTAASIAALTIYDMCKAIDRAMVISNVHLLLKDGGKSGRFERAQE
jgi:cyclic pyranopterin phosphate synthase